VRGEEWQLDDGLITLLSGDLEGVVKIRCGSYLEDA